ncbi:hypothetical protein GCM10022247_47000 [Allokutzneria multivorans]|uniref:DUF6879 domain-containing protein n=1 Tax=Allokutzneria multivorans TaxID=1142134 RepID=A0ABP7SYA4_9PSEU
MIEVDGAAVTDLFQACRSAWRWEAQPTYTIPTEQPTLAQFLAGEPKPENHNASWHRRIAAWTAEGKRIARVRVLSHPLTDYQRYQLAWGIPGNMAAGEDVRVFDPESHPDVVAPQQDFWIFDGPADVCTVLRLNFDPDGRLLNRTLVAEAEQDRYRSWQQVAINSSVPLRDWDARS